MYLKHAFWRYLKWFITVVKTKTVNGAFWRYLKRIRTAETIKTRYLKHAFWQYLKRFGTVGQHENKDTYVCIMTLFVTVFETAMRNRDGDGCILTLFGMIFWNRREIFEYKDNKWCILSLFNTIFWPAENVLKAMKLNGAFWRFLSPMLSGIR